MARAVGTGIRIFGGVLMAAAIGVVVTPISAANNSDPSQTVAVGDHRDGNDDRMRAGGRVLWKRQPGTSDFDTASGVATDRQDNVYIVGETTGALGGANKGSVDAWIIKYNRRGRVLWKRQPGTEGGDSANAVATDWEGNVYVVGRSEERQPSFCNDAWVIKYDAHGRVLWKRRFASSGDDLANGVATDRDGNVYVVGVTQGELFRPNNMQDDAWIVKLDGDGRALWKRQFGTDFDDAANAVATDKHGNVYVVGRSDGSLGGPNPSEGVSDAWVMKFDASGQTRWRRSFSTGAFDSAKGVATDRNGNVYVAGQIFLADPALGAWVVQYSSNGFLEWERQPGKSSNDSANGVAADQDHHVYVVGRAIFTDSNATVPDHDAFVAVFDSRGQPLRQQRLATEAFDDATAVATDRHGDVYVVGGTGGDLGGANKGIPDAWIIKFKGAGHERR